MRERERERERQRERETERDRERETEMREMGDFGEGEATMDFNFVTEGKFNHDRIL